MQGPIVQIISLTLAGNAAARGHDLGRYWPDDDTFKFCRYVRFFDGSPEKQDGRLTVIAGDPTHWLRGCQAPGLRVQLAYEVSQRRSLSDRLSVGFVGGGGIWSMRVAGDAPMAGIWQPHWRVGDRRVGDLPPPDRRIWEVGYFRQTLCGEATSAPLQLSELIAALATTLGAIEDFANRQNLMTFTRCFARARALLGTTVTPEQSRGEALDPFGMLPPPALHLLRACEAAWVFGGMGSWNDLGFSGEDGQRYETLSNELFQLLAHCIVAAVNQAAIA